MATSRRHDGKILFLFFIMSLMVSGFIALDYVPVREIAESMPVLQKFFPQTRLNPLSSKRAAMLDFRDISLMRQQVEAREKLVAEREKAVETDMQMVARFKGEIEKSRKQILDLEARVTQLVTMIDESEAKNLRKLAKIYNSMDAEEAANMIDSMDDDEVVNILARMKERQIGKVLGAYAGKSDKTAERSARLIEKIRVLTTEMKKQRQAAAAAPGA